MSVFQLQIKRQKSTWKVPDICPPSQKGHNFFYLNIFQKCLLIYDLFNTVIWRVTLRTITHEWLLVEWWSKCCSVCETWCYLMLDFRTLSPNTGRDIAKNIRFFDIFWHSEHEDDLVRFLKSGAVNSRLNLNKQKKLDLKRIRTYQVTTIFMDTTFCHNAFPKMCHSFDATIQRINNAHFRF